MGTSNNFHNEPEGTGYDCRTSFFFSSSSKKEPEHCWNIFKMLEKVATENKLSDTPGNIFNIDESGI